MSTEVLTEAASIAEAGPKGIWRSKIIAADVQGSSGYYPGEVLRRDGATAFPAGTHIYLDHPTSEEEETRPERSVRDLAGFMVEDARYEDDPEEGPGLYARVQFLPHVKDLVKSIYEHVGLSIRAAGEIAETATGRVVQSIQHGLSVDVVTRAGAGGRLITMTESTKPESPPAEGTTGPKDGTTIPSTSGTGALLSEVASMRDTLSDRVEQLSVEVARLGHQLKESQREAEKRTAEAKTISEALTFLTDRQKAADQLLAESKNVNDVLGDLLKANLPLPSLVRLAENYRPGQDVHAAITQERDYVKKVFRESERGHLGSEEGGKSSGLGLSESMFSPAADLSEDYTEVDNLLSGRF